jgi:O-antigen/teichoic acid export membrane protein
LDGLQFCPYVFSRRYLIGSSPVCCVGPIIQSVWKRINRGIRTSCSQANDMFKRLCKGVGANFLGQLINIASRFLLVPLFLLAWGANIYGEWLLLSSMVAYLTLTDMGGATYIGNRMTQAFAHQDHELFRKILHTGLALFLIIPLAVYLIFVATISFFNPASLFHITQTSHRLVVLVLALLAFQFVISLPQGILIRVYFAVEMLPRGVMLLNFMQFLSLSLVAGGLWLGWGMVPVALLQIIPYGLIAVMALYDLNQKFPQFQILSLKRADFFFGLSFIKPSLHFFLIQISQASSIQGIVLVVGMVLGPVQVVLFSTIRTLVNLIRSFFAQVSHAAWPEMTRLDAQQDMDKFLALFRIILRTTLIASVLFMAVFHFFGGFIYHFWLRKTVPFEQPVMDLFLIYMGQFIFWLTCSHPLLATNRHQTLAKMLFISSILTIGLAYLGGQHLGLQGIVLGMIIGDLILPFWFVPYLLSGYQACFSFKFFTNELIPYIGSLVILALIPWLAPVVFLLLLAWWLRAMPSHLITWRQLKLKNYLSMK